MTDNEYKTLGKMSKENFHYMCTKCNKEELLLPWEELAFNNTPLNGSGNENDIPDINNISINTNEDIWVPFKNCGLHFLHININSILPKIDEIREMAILYCQGQQ